MKVVEMEGQLEELNIKLAAQEAQIAESVGLVTESEIKLTEQGIKIAESEQ